MKSNGVNYLDISEPDNNGIYDLDKVRRSVHSGPLFIHVNGKQFTRSEMKSFGDHCRVVMNGRYSDQAMDALLDTWIENRNIAKLNKTHE